MAKTSSDKATATRPITRVALENLLLDPNNPRFGQQEQSQSQQEILDHIVGKFGVSDVLSSLAVNGFFEAEPIICRRPKDSQKSIVVEGNRRLAACLILAGDPRAKNQATRTIEFQKIWKEHKSPSIDPIPSMIFEGNESKKELLSYLGVRHIASSQPWDSFAKAAWVAEVVKTSGMSISEVSQMIGDRHRTVNRLLEGFYVVEQLTEAGEFVPSDSVRRGRGSVTDYPFSWIYTSLGYKTIRDYLQLNDNDAKRNPITKKNLGSGGILLRSMFGDSSKGRNAAIEDSREISALAKVFSSKEQVKLLQEGKSVSQIISLTKPIDEQLSEGLIQAKDILRNLLAGLSEHEVSEELAKEHIVPSGAVRKLANDLDKKVNNLAAGNDD